MKTIRTKKGPFSERPYFEDSEIERICVDELRKADLLPKLPAPVRIDRFVEKRFAVTIEYEDLGPGVLGLTVFGLKGVHRVVVARSLDAENTESAQRRVRSTLAHEAGHGLLHTALFAVPPENRPLFADYSDPKSPKVLCRDLPSESNVSGYNGKWWEFQANKAMGCLLLPRKLVETALQPFLTPHGTLGEQIVPTDRRSDAARALSVIFDVNPMLARIRIDNLYPEKNEAQGSL